MLSYWEQQSLTAYDYAVIGAGIVGLSTAIELRSKFPDARIIVLERGILPSGASTRNAGFACMGSVTELLADLRTMSEQEVVELFAWRKMGLQLLRERLGDDNIGYAENGSYELLAAEEVGALGEIARVNELLKEHCPTPAFSICPHPPEYFGFSSSCVAAIITNNCEGELHTGKMMHALMQVATKAGIEVKTSALVQAVDEDESEVRLVVSDQVRRTVELTARYVVNCTNAFARDLLPELDVTPGRGQVLITEPIPNLPFRGIYHFDEGYYYFRELDGRVLIGGGRNADIAGETTTEQGLHHPIQQLLEEKLNTIVLPGKPYKIAMRWSGIMAFGPTKFPIVAQVSPRGFAALRMGGMGVALGSEAARRVAMLIP
ncbi:MAG: FAD-binding oxidoreductase [Chitinophagia bacterium]|nr:FAD-binding oxidoreductase [Chitinophagia bacterium]